MNSMQCQQVLFQKNVVFFGRSKESRSQIVQRRVAVEPLKTNISPLKIDGLEDDSCPFI